MFMHIDAEHLVEFSLLLLFFTSVLKIMLEAYCQDDKGRVWLYILHQFYGEILFWRCMGFYDFH